MSINTRKGFTGEVIIKEIKAKSLLRKYKKIDSWFISRYGMNFYRGCRHACAYCDGRAEGYYVENDFHNEVEVKVNAPELLRRELDPARKRKPLKKSFIMPGGGISDSYQPIEKKFRITRRALEIIKEHDFPVHMLTKSTSIENDMDILQEINNQSRAIVSMSFSSVDEKVSKVFEPGVPSPQKRLETLARFKEAGITVGMFLLPVIPLITDSGEMMEAAVQKAVQTGLDFIIFGGMTLKEGRQKKEFFETLKKFKPELVAEYNKIYSGDKWGNAHPAYYGQLYKNFYAVAGKYKIPLRIPSSLFSDLIDKDDLVVVILEQLDYILKLKGRSSSFAHAARSVSQIKEPLAEVADDLQKYRGIGPKTVSIIKEILKTGRCKWYEKELLG